MFYCSKSFFSLYGSDFKFTKNKTNYTYSIISKDYVLVVNNVVCI